MSEILDRIYPDNESQLFFTEIADHRKYIIELEQQLQQAHQLGWEQCQREAAMTALEYDWCRDNPSKDIANDIASMEYKEVEK